MKKLILLSALALMMNSCTKEEVVSTTPTTVQQNLKKNIPLKELGKLSLEERRAYVIEHFRPMAQELLKLAQQKEFKTYVYMEVSKQFDGEDNVLLNTLLTSKYLKDLGAIIPHCEAFINIDGSDYYPQIYIPNYKKSNATNGKSPIFVFYNGEEKEGGYNGYTLDAQGELVAVPELITEDYSKENEVWVLSLNERGGINAIKPVSTQPTNKSMSPVIQTMTIKDHKEGWLAGGSEIAIQSYANWNNPSIAKNWTNVSARLSYNGTLIHWNTTGAQFIIANFSRKEVSNKTQKWVNYSYFPNWEPSVYGDCFFYGIYEDDVDWLSTPMQLLNTNVTSPMGRTKFIECYSNDAPYFKGTITSTWAYYTAITSGAINFSTY